MIMMRMIMMRMIMIMMMMMMMVMMMTLTSIEQQCIEAGMATPTRGNDGGDYDDELDNDNEYDDNDDDNRVWERLNSPILYSG